ncbi:MAG: hypothetical protein MUW56_07650 [Chryseobacterium sp.]|uniref:DUF5724 domain-containing protein n=1 Tax=Chryseobacterium sp. TaxID=1871047 RepID=UPI0025C31DDE|nr:hypothetical protein [Chryseobacterium sp.]MCJ7933501.1 hypothetical protein [Chryseobacterium sp.]
MEITKKLESKKLVKNYYEKLRKDLVEQAEKGMSTQVFPDKPMLKKEVAELGLFLMGKTNYYQAMTLGSKEAEKLKAYIKPDIWEDADYYNLLAYYFGENADLVKYAWNKMPYKMYQMSYTRRSFRAPHNERYVLMNQVNLVRELLRAPSIYSYNSNDQNYDLSLEEQIIYDNELANNPSQFYVWSAAIDTGNTAIYQLIEDIILINIQRERFPEISLRLYSTVKRSIVGNWLRSFYWQPNGRRACGKPFWKLWMRPV